MLAYLLCASAPHIYVLCPTDLFCGSPPLVRNGSPGVLTSTMIGGTISYNCEHGYILLGPVTVTCLSTGRWSTLPSCESEFIFLVTTESLRIIGHLMVTFML